MNEIQQERFEEAQADNKKDAQPKNPTKRIQISVLVFVVLIFAVTTALFVFQLSSAGVIGSKDAVEVAETQGNLGNYNVECVKNTLLQKLDGSYELTVQINFTNYASEGMSFDEAVYVVAYQDNKEVPLIYDIEFQDEDAAADLPENESSLKVRNGREASVVLTYALEAPDENVNIEMESNSNTYTYTVNLEG